jgi:ATP-binding cassette subfamily C (CFTR/MRP) protein 1
LEKAASKTPSAIWIALLRSFGPRYLWAGFLKVGADLTNIAQPRSFQVLITYIMDYQSGKTHSKPHGFAIAFGIFAYPVLHTVCINQYNLIAMQTGIRIESALTMAVYDKTTKLSNKARASNPSGTIATQVTVDIQRVKLLAEFGHNIWSTPLQIGLTLYFLYQLLGASAFIGFAALIGIIPLNTFVSKCVQCQNFKNGRLLTALGRCKVFTLSNERIGMRGQNC